jgi:ectoine hydroxylase-related dioxygenase (phytanoyl-CoA dioxygenase family)
MTAPDQAAEEIKTQGYTIIENVLTPDYVARTKKELMAAIKHESEANRGPGYRDYAMVLLCSLYGKTFWEPFDNKALMAPFNAVLGEGCIVYAYTSSSMPPKAGNYSNRIHVDCPRLIPGYVTNMGATIALDDFTADNGATWFLPGSHNTLEQPSEDPFYKNGKRFIAKAGSVLFFNARLWHAGGQNLTDQWRHALTINMARPWMKQRIDIPRAMSHLDLSGLSEAAQQKLGFLAQVPANYDEYYAPPEKRKYRQKTE